jgi:serine/threonine protein kinase
MKNAARFSRQQILAGIIGLEEPEAAPAWLAVLEEDPGLISDADIAAAEREDSLIGELRESISAGPFQHEPELEAAQNTIVHGQVSDDTLTRSAYEQLDDSQEEGVTVFPPGTVFHEYRILACLGRGGMGAVYRALHTKLNREVALKVLSPELTRLERFRARFEREMQALGRVDHPQIVKAIHAGQADCGQYLVMDLVEGTDLRRLLKSKKKLPVADACEIIRQIALALQHVHEKGLVHRDIKPSNIMVTQHGAVKLLDLGLARIPRDEPDHLTSSGQVVGTVDYMAPEQAQDPAGTDIRGDIYSLGCTLYALLSGEPPFESSPTMASKFIAHASAPVHPLPGLPSGLNSLLAAMLAKKPADRPATPAVVAQLLTSYCVGQRLDLLLNDKQSGTKTATEIVSAQTSPVTRKQSGAWSTKQILTMAGTAAILLFAGVVIIKYIDNDGKEQTTKVNVDGDIKKVEINNSVEQPRVVSADYDHQIAVKFIGRGGGIGINPSSPFAAIGKLSDIPEGKIEIHTLYMPPDATDADLRKLNGLFSLRVIDLKGKTNVTDEGIKQLDPAKLPRLKEIYLTSGDPNKKDPQITADGLRQLVEKFPNLQGISVHTAMSDRCLAEVAKLKELRIFFAAGPFSDAALAQVAKCRKLQEFVVHECPAAASEVVSALSERQDLRDVRLASDDLTDALASKLAQCQSLRRIDLMGRRLTGKPLADFAKLPELRQLVYWKAEFVKDDLAPIAEFPKLEVLDLRDNNITDDMLEPITRCKTLINIGITNSECSQAGQELIKTAFPAATIHVLGK